MNRCKRILVVEDNEDVRESIVDVLASEGYAVETARNGKEALLKLETMDDPTLVLLDLMMPVMNGWEFIDAQKKDRRFKNHRIVTISAVNPTQSIEDPTPLDVDGKISKPLSLEGIWAEVRKHCDAALPTDLALA